MKYGNNELRERWKAIKRQAWNDDEFNEQVEKFEKYAVEEFQRVQKNANIKLRMEKSLQTAINPVSTFGMVFV